MTPWATPHRTGFGKTLQRDESTGHLSRPPLTMKGEDRPDRR